MEQVTVCTNCDSTFWWDSQAHLQHPDCPNCGHNPRHQHQAGDLNSLVHLLQTGDVYKSSGAAAELGKLPDESALEPLTKIFLAQKGPSDAAAIALCKIGAADAMQLVAENINRFDSRSYDELLDALCLHEAQAMPILTAIPDRDS